ncbi:hypothetical protein PM082_010101 [Marasmius tenuissimus]|nr:hypothetical protein PM082_010101 [Marasmius tenuissimus]
MKDFRRTGKSLDTRINYGCLYTISTSRRARCCDVLDQMSLDDHHTFDYEMCPGQVPSSHDPMGRNPTAFCSNSKEDRRHSLCETGSGVGADVSVNIQSGSKAEVLASGRNTSRREWVRCRLHRLRAPSGRLWPQTTTKFLFRGLPCRPRKGYSAKLWTSNRKKEAAKRVQFRLIYIRYRGVFVALLILLTSHLCRPR